MRLLSQDSLEFPSPDTANPYGAVAIGGDLSYERLLVAYEKGFFPWYNPDEPIIWWHPDPRFVLFPEDIRITKSMRPYFNQQKFRITFDSCFEDVLVKCRDIKRKDQAGTWISDDIIEAYAELHENGLAHSLEVWNQSGELVGGLYGVSFGKVFFGESMFSQESNASKFALISLAKLLMVHNFALIDCQMPNPHLKRMGGCYIKRTKFLEILEKNKAEKTIKGNWEELINTVPTYELLNVT